MKKLLMIIIVFTSVGLSGCYYSKNVVTIRSNIAAAYMGLDEMPMPTNEDVDKLAYYNSEVPDKVRVLKDIEYSNYQGNTKKLDLYLPQSSGKHPLLIYVHGGAFVAGKRTQIVQDIKEQTARGYALASLSYSLADEAKWPVQIYQLKAAVRWLRANAKSYHLDRDKFIAVGPSAGGTLVTILGTSGDVPELEGAEWGSRGYSSRVQGVVAYYPSSDLKLMSFGANAKPNNISQQLLGCHQLVCSKKADSANAITYITPDDPPFYIMHGTSDSIVPHSESSLMYDALLANGVETTFISLPGYTHGDERFYTGGQKAGIEKFLDYTSQSN
jgi:acetyl esterase/lipase